MRKYGKFAALIVVVIGTLVWLALLGLGTAKPTTNRLTN